MNDVGAAILFAQPFVQCGRVDQHLAASLAGVRHLQQPIRIQARDDERRALVGERIHGRDRIVALAQQCLDQRIVLIEEAPGGIIVFDRQLSAGKTVIGGRYIDQRYPDSRWRLAKVADLDFQRLIGQAGSAQGDKYADTKQKPQQSRLPCYVQTRCMTGLHRNISF